jgi:hypothetical protein
MMREMPRHRTSNRAANAALRLGRRTDSQTGWNGDDQSGTSDTHGFLPELVGEEATLFAARGSD